MSTHCRRRAERSPPPPPPPDGSASAHPEGLAYTSGVQHAWPWALLGCPAAAFLEFFKSFPENEDVVQQGFREGEGVFCVLSCNARPRIVSALISQRTKFVCPLFECVVKEIH